MSIPDSIAKAITSSKFKDLDYLLDKDSINSSYMYPLGCYYFNLIHMASNKAGKGQKPKLKGLVNYYGFFVNGKNHVYVSDPQYQVPYGHDGIYWTPLQFAAAMVINLLLIIW